MPRVLKILFFSVLVLALISLGLYFYYFGLNKSQNIGGPYKSENQFGIEDGGLYGEYIERNAYRTIQGIYIDLSEGKLLYKDRYTGDKTMKSVLINEEVLYVCMPPKFSDDIGLSEENTGYRDIIKIGQLSQILSEDDPIAIVTIADESNIESVNYIISAKCESADSQ